MPGNLLSPVGPSPIYCETGDAITFNATGNSASAAYIIVYRMVLSSGIIQEFSFQGTGGTGNGPSYTQMPLPEGWLISASVTCNNSAVQAGQSLAQLYIGRIQAPDSAAGANYSSMLLISACIPGFQTASWPANTRFGTDGQGWNQNFTVANPSAGANFSFTFNAQQRFQVVNVRFTLATSAVAGNRVVGIKFTAPSSGPIFCSSQCPQTQPISSTCNYNFSCSVGGVTSLAVAGGLVPEQVTPMPFGLYISDGSILASTVAAMDVADQLSNIAIRVLSWHEND